MRVGEVDCPGGGSVVDWHFHQYNKVGDRVYDNLTGPEGMSFADYKEQFRNADGLFWDQPPMLR